MISKQNILYTPACLIEAHMSHRRQTAKHVSYEAHMSHWKHTILIGVVFEMSPMSHICQQWISDRSPILFDNTFI